MPWNLSSDRPIFLQIVERIEMDIISGVYQPGQRLQICDLIFIHAQCFQLSQPRQRAHVQPSFRALCKEPFPNSKEPA